METFHLFVQHWLTPALFFALATAALLVFGRAHWATSRVGGVLLGLMAALLLGLALTGPDFRRLAADPERLALLIFALLAAVVVWNARRRLRLDSRDAVTTSEEGPDAVEIGAGGMAALLAAGLAFVFAAPLAPIHDFAADPAGQHAPWFLLAGEEAERHFAFGVSPWTGASLFLLGLFAVMLWSLPFLDPETAGTAADRSETGERREPLFVFLFAGALLVLVPSLIAAFLVPLHEQNVPPTAAGSLSELFWQLLRDAVPQSGWLREAPGLLLLAFYFGALPWILPRWGPARAVFGRYRRRLASTWHFALAMILFLVVLYVPLGLAVRFILGVEAVVALPEFGLRL